VNTLPETVSQIENEAGSAVVSDAASLAYVALRSAGGRCNASEPPPVDLIQRQQKRIRGVWDAYSRGYGGTDSGFRLSRARDHVLGSIEAEIGVRRAAGRDVGNLERVFARMRDCSSRFQIWRCYSEPGKSRPVPVNHCHVRVCPYCQAQRVQKLLKRTIVRLEDCRKRDRPLMFITPTQRRRVGESLLDGHRRLSRDLKRLRCTKEWKRHVKGGQIHYDVTGGDGWHVHAHVVADCTYWPKEELQAVWARVTGGESFVIDIRKARAGVELEAVKYAVKLVSLMPAQIVEYVETTSRVRCVTTFGDWHRKGEDIEKEIEPDAVVDAGSDGELTSHLRLVEEEFDGDTSATVVLAAVVSYVREHAGEVVARRLLLAFDVARAEVEARCRSA